MKKGKFLIVAIGLVGTCFVARAQRTIAEASFVYKITGMNLNNASTTVYIKGNNSRSEMVSQLGKEITIFNTKADNAVILKEFSGQKLMITLTKENWREKNATNGDIKFVLTSEYKTIGNYQTRKAVATMANGKSFDVFYTPDLVPANKEYDATFSNLPGLAVEYEIESGNMTFKYSLAQINYDPVPVSMFDFPTSGYRVMTYLENQKLKKGN
ncbi:MAG: hypothetical protein IPL84_09370 [Chitinophagaceae bacterium]|nr:hypothetical protein [Chitinophagaceae bacterium]